MINQIKMNLKLFQYNLLKINVLKLLNLQLKINDYPSFIEINIEENDEKNM